MKRRDYQRPTMKVVQLRHTGLLMTSGEPAGTQSSINGWGNGGSDTEDVVM